MKNLVAQFPDQLRQAIVIGESSKITPHSSSIRNVLITGLGGSGIGGTIAAEIVSVKCPVPVVVNKDYFLPAFVDESTLVIVSSYSGNTEETVQAMDAAMKRKAKIVCITSGGKIAETAKANGLDLVLIPGGMPPRSCLGFSLTQLFYVMKYCGLIDGTFKQELEAAVTLIEKESPSIHDEANRLTDFLFRKTPVIYAADGYNGVATRFRQQINENSKMLCWHHILPEMNHNELVGWAESHQECAVVFLRSDTDYFRTKARMDISKEVIGKWTPNILEIHSKGSSQLERSIHLIHLTDWASCYLADRKGIDAVEVNVINYLKGSLEKI